jgi:hypothetical protein
MSLNTWQESLLTHRGDGTALTAAARASLLQGATATRALYTFPANFFEQNKRIRVTASGRISCAVTTPGTARFDITLGGTNVWDSLAINLNIVAKTNVPWYLDVDLICQASGNGTTALLFPGRCSWTSEANVGTAVPTANNTGSYTIGLPYNTAPAVGGGFTSVVSNQMDLSFTQTVATGSVQLHTLCIEALN